MTTTQKPGHAIVARSTVTVAGWPSELDELREENTNLLAERDQLAACLWGVAVMIVHQWWPHTKPRSATEVDTVAGPVWDELLDGVPVTQVDIDAIYAQLEENNK